MSLAYGKYDYERHPRYENSPSRPRSQKDAGLMRVPLVLCFLLVFAVGKAMGHPIIDFIWQVGVDLVTWLLGLP